MGCSASADKETEDSPLTNEHRQLIAESWKELHVDLERIGMLLFMGMFDTHPETRQFFGFSDNSALSEDPNHIKRLREHGLRFMSLLKKLMTCINDKERFDSILLNLGKRHVHYKADVDLVDLFGEQFVISIRPALKHSWNPKVEEAWTQLFKHIAGMMKRGMLENENDMAPSTKK